MIDFVWRQDYTALILSFLYVFAVIGVGELLRRVGKRSPDFTRKFIHIGVGMWAVGTVVLFETRGAALIPPAVFVIINAVSYWRGTFKAMETGEKGNLGTIYFPIAFGALIFMFWDRPVLLVAAMMPLTWGDAMAAIVGRRHGEHTYTVMGKTRSLEGSVAMLFWSWVATSVALFAVPYLVGAPAVEWLLALIYGGVVALVCTVVEALSPWGIDNLTIPAAAAIVLNALLSF